jgi:hypothetical protein
MQCDWLGERVATVDVDRAITNVIHSKEDAGWGPNAVFRLAGRGGGAVRRVYPWPSRQSKQQAAAGGTGPSETSARLLCAVSGMLRNSADSFMRPHPHTHTPAHRFPLEGGTGGIWKGVARLLPAERQRYSQQLVSLDKERQVARFADGRQVGSWLLACWGLAPATLLCLCLGLAHSSGWLHCPASLLGGPLPGPSAAGSPLLTGAVWH